MKNVTITHLDQISNKTSLKTNRVTFLLIALFILLISVVGIFLLGNIEDKIREETGEKLQTINNTTSEALNLWLDQKILDVTIKASEDEFQRITEKLFMVPRRKEALLKSDEQRAIREYLVDWLNINNDLGFFIITPDSTNIASLRDEDVGMKNLIFAERGSYLNEAFRGKIVFIPPITSDIPLPETSGKVSSGFSTIFIASPVKSKNGKINAVLAIRLNLAYNFSKITKIGRFGQTGESYAVDEEGKLLTESLFESVLRKAGFLNQSTITRTTFEVRDPGIEIQNGLSPNIARYRQPFTKSALGIIAHKNGVNVEGYSGYLGNRVLGAWKWSDRLGVGITTEIAEEESLSLYSRIRMLNLGAICLIAAFAFSLILGMFWVRDKSFKALKEINEKLEENILGRTQELANSNAELVDSWERFRKLTHHSHDLNKIIGSDGVIKFESSAVERILGTRQGDRIGKKFFDFIHPEDIVSVQRVIENIIHEANQIGQAEYRYKKIGDGWVVLESFMQNFIDDPNIEGIIINSRDVTDRRLVEEKVKKSEQRFRSVWENSKDGMRITDSEGMMLMVNNMFCNMVKKEQDELIGESISAVYIEKMQEEILRDFLKEFESGGVIGLQEEEVKLWDTTTLWFSFSNSFIHLDDGSKVLLSVVRNITESKKTEFIRQIIYNINTTVFEANSYDDLLRRVHGAFSEFIKTDNFFIATYNKGSNTISIPYMVDKSDSVKDIPIDKTFTGYVIKKGEPVLLREKDSAKMVESGEVNLIGKLAKVWLGVPIMVREELSGVMVIQDYEDEYAIGETELEIIKFVSDQVGLVMDRILSREALIKSENDLREANQTKDKFFSILAHDLRNPFVTILGFSDILQEDYKDMDDDERLNLIAEMRTTAQSTYGLLENLLNWSRSEIGTLKITPRLFHLKGMVESVYSLVDGNAKMKSIKLDYEVDHGVKVFADKSTVETVLRNLVTNAIKFTNSGGEVKVIALDRDDHIEILVKDNGIGIKPEMREKIFSLKESTTTRGTANEAGSGLGLVLCKEFVERNKGAIWVESKEEDLSTGRAGGSTFIFTLPKM